MSETTAMRTLPIGTAALALGVTRDNLYKHIERGRTVINGVPFSAQQGPDKRWKVTIPQDLTPFQVDEGQLGQDGDGGQDSAEALTIDEQLAQALEHVAALRLELAAIRAERDSYKNMIEATHQATLNTLERVVAKLTEPPALPAPEPPKKRSWFSLR
ncbi:MAG TPA: hypothetical protein VGL77_18455 [Armatimonadota bacterium]